MSNPLVIAASSGAISSFISLDGKHGVRGESFTAPLANRLIKVFATLFEFLPASAETTKTQTPTVSLSRMEPVLSCRGSPVAASFEHSGPVQNTIDRVP